MQWIKKKKKSFWFIPTVFHKGFYKYMCVCIKNVHNEDAAAKSLQSCPTLCDPMDRSLPGSSIHGIFQARVLEWGAIAFYYNEDIVCHLSDG